MGATARFTVVTFVGTNGVQYQWQKAINQTDWAAIPGATSPELMLSQVSASDAGTYRVVVSSQLPFPQFRLSNSADLTVAQRPQVSGLAMHSFNNVGKVGKFKILRVGSNTIARRFRSSVSIPTSP